MFLLEENWPIRVNKMLGFTVFLVDKSRVRLFGGTVPPSKKLFGGTIPPNNLFCGGTLMEISFW